MLRGSGPLSMFVRADPPAGNDTRRAPPCGDEIDYNYGATTSLNTTISRLDSMSEGTVTLESFTYMGLSTVVEEDHSQDGVNLTYIASSAGGDGGDIYQGLDRFGRVTTQNWEYATSSTFSADKDIYHYDADGNVTEEDYPLAVVIPASHSLLDETFTYNNLNRLTQVSHFSGFSTANNQTFALSAAGAITGITTGGVLQNRTVNSENQITAIGSSSISYDSNGNVTTDDQGRTLVFDAWNRLVGVNNSSGQLIATYTYDGLGRIASETSVDLSTLATTTTDLYYAGGQEVEERTGVTDSFGDNLSSNGTVTLNNVFSPNGGNILLRDSGGTRLYFTHDVAGDVTAVLNTSGSALQRESYTAYGDVSFLTSNFGSSTDGYNLTYLWQNGERDTITKMYKFGYRWYTPNMQWLSFDPSGYPDGPNGYIDRADNPINRVDPMGLAAGPTTRPAFEPGGDHLFIVEGDHQLHDTNRWWFGDYRHYSIELWSGCKVPTKLAVTRTSDLQKAGDKRLESVQLEPDWNWEAPVASGVLDWVWVSYISYNSADSDKAANIYGAPGVADSDVKAKWGQIIDAAHNYQYAEQEGWNGNFVHWPNSEYTSWGNNCNTFVWSVLAGVGLPNDVLPGNHAGNKSPVPNPTHYLGNPTYTWWIFCRKPVK